LLVAEFHAFVVAYQAKKYPAEMVAELTALSKAEASEKYRKKEGSIWFNPISAEILETTPDLLKKYSDTEYVMDWIERVYYNAHIAFQPCKKVPNKDYPKEPYSLLEDLPVQRFTKGIVSKGNDVLGASKCLVEAGSLRITTAYALT